jgi:carbonic anhydrase
MKHELASLGYERRSRRGPPSRRIGNLSAAIRDQGLSIDPPGSERPARGGVVVVRRDPGALGRSWVLLLHHAWARTTRLDVMSDKTEPNISPEEALQRLREGNERFANNVRSVEALVSQMSRRELAAGQRPFATILACSDSRAPAEIVFDQGLGDLFVVRVAGNVVAPSIIGSVEFAATVFATPLAVVMGHSKCGAVGATLDAVQSQTRAASDNIHDIVERIEPAVTTVLSAAKGLDRPHLLRESIRANVRSSADHLRHGSKLLENLIKQGKLQVIGAEYDLESGKVDFFERA